MTSCLPSAGLLAGLAGSLPPPARLALTLNLLDSLSDNAEFLTWASAQMIVVVTLATDNFRELG